MARPGCCCRCYCRCWLWCVSSRANPDRPLRVTSPRDGVCVDITPGGQERADELCDHVKCTAPAPAVVAFCGCLHTTSGKFFCECLRSLATQATRTEPPPILTCASNLSEVLLGVRRRGATHISPCAAAHADSLLSCLVCVEE
ncbi:unnamed protein product, partial [Ectocarpus fasciculatus]